MDYTQLTAAKGVVGSVATWMNNSTIVGDVPEMVLEAESLDIPPTAPLENAHRAGQRHDDGQPGQHHLTERHARTLYVLVDRPVPANPPDAHDARRHRIMVLDSEWQHLRPHSTDPDDVLSGSSALRFDCSA